MQPEKSQTEKDIERAAREAEDAPEGSQGRASFHHGSTTQGGSNFGQGSHALSGDSYKQGDTANDGTNYNNEAGKLNELRDDESAQNDEPQEEHIDT